MRVLLVSSTTVGGSGRSQQELAAMLNRAGHPTQLLADDGRRAPVKRRLYEELSDLVVRLEGTRGHRPVQWMASIPGRRVRPLRLAGATGVESPMPQNALPQLLRTFRPDVVVGNSLIRHSWRRVRHICAVQGIPTVLYVREVASLDHLLPGELPDVVVANARSLVAAVEQRGVACAFVPSVIDLAPTRTTSTRLVALAINPLTSHGVETVVALARRLPAIPFVLQESWPLDRRALGELEDLARAISNLELRRAGPPGPELYADARVLLVPHRIDNRPRVIAEAHANGIPVIGSSVSGIAEAVGPGGSTLDPDDIDAWEGELRSFWSDSERYDALALAAQRHSARPELDPELVTKRFLELLERAADRTGKLS